MPSTLGRSATTLLARLEIILNSATDYHAVEEPTLLAVRITRESTKALPGADNETEEILIEDSGRVYLPQSFAAQPACGVIDSRLRLEGAVSTVLTSTVAFAAFRH